MDTGCLKSTTEVTVAMVLPECFRENQGLKVSPSEVISMSTRRVSLCPACGGRASLEMGDICPHCFYEEDFDDPKDYDVVAGKRMRMEFNREQSVLQCLAQRVHGEIHHDFRGWHVVVWHHGEKPNYRKFYVRARK